MAGLSLLQRREAQRLQLKGKTLREIARSIGATYEQVCLSLFGGIHDWEPRIGEPVCLDDINYREVNDDRKLDAGGAGGLVGREHGDGPTPRSLPAPAEPIPEPPRAAVRPVPEPRPAPPAPQPAAAPVAPPEPPRPEVPHAHPAPVAEPAPAAQPQAPEPPQLYRLTNGAGEYLHKSGSGMTRNRDGAWQGTAPQMEEAFRRKPHLKDLDPERVRG